MSKSRSTCSSPSRFPSGTASSSSSYLYYKYKHSAMAVNRLANSADSSPAASTPPTPAASIAALPSFTHSLSSFPSMTSVTTDMVHYGTLGGAKDASRAKNADAFPNETFIQLNVMLEHTKQRKDTLSHSDTTNSTLFWPQGDQYSHTQDDEQLLVIPRRKHKMPGSQGFLGASQAQALTLTLPLPLPSLFILPPRDFPSLPFINLDDPLPHHANASLSPGCSPTLLG
ncbi:hypothetical protein NLI96_g10353 [Meripilus lineatus]|uniref:Uncharacterized protein n=1 Tax=Meripilus lineatus TaxID=2056292 RepID=A0AAD5UU35_9APHY|nr:hypothetical protein NLI96_g10353 [Physisporinus lineatus]